MNDIYEKIAQLLKDGFKDWASMGDINLKEWDNLVLFNYSRQAQYARNWTPLEVASRGLIIDKVTGEIVARPFEKFFNWGEWDVVNKKQWKGIRTVTKKMDGSLGILYRKDGGLYIATRGSFSSEQAEWATDFLHSQSYDLGYIPDELTLMFEIIYPDNKVVLNYNHEERLVLLGARNRFTGEYLPYQGLVNLSNKVGLEVVEKVEVTNTKQLLEWAKTLEDAEGWVAEFDNGKRLKFKGDWYIEMHKVVSHYSKKRVCEWWVENTYSQNIAMLPDELYSEADAIVSALYRMEKTWEDFLYAVYKDLKNQKIESRKHQALWIKNNAPVKLIPFLFALLDGKDFIDKFRKFVADLLLKEMQRCEDLVNKV